MYFYLTYLFLPMIDAIVLTEIHRSATYHPVSSCALLPNVSLLPDASIQSCIWGCAYEDNCQTAVYFNDEKICSMFTEFCKSDSIQSSGHIRASVICYQKSLQPDITCTSTVIADQAETMTTTVSSMMVNTVQTIASNTCTSTWRSPTRIYHCNDCINQLFYQLYSFNYVAIANVTRVAFMLRRDLGHFAIDDVSIRNTATPGIELLSNGGFETGNISSWTHCVQNGSLATGSVQSTSSGIYYSGYAFAAHSGSYYYLCGATVYAEYLSQTIPSIIENTYNFNFSYVYAGNGSSSIGDFLIST